MGCKTEAAFNIALMSSSAAAYRRHQVQPDQAPHGFPDRLPEQATALYALQARCAAGYRPVASIVASPESLPGRGPAALRFARHRRCRAMPPTSRTAVAGLGRYSRPEATWARHTPRATALPSWTRRSAAASQACCARLRNEPQHQRHRLNENVPDQIYADPPFTPAAPG